MSLASHKSISPNVEERRKSQEKGNRTSGRANIKINFLNMIDELQKIASSKNEKSFVEKLLKSKMPSRNDVLGVKTNTHFIDSIMENMTKGIVYLYKNIDVTIDEYLASEEDRFVMEDADGIVLKSRDTQGNTIVRTDPYPNDAAYDNETMIRFKTSIKKFASEIER